MFLELAEVLDCPVCRDGFGLVAFVSASERRRVIEGRLGCPICEIELPIHGGTIDAARAPADPVPEDAVAASPADLGEASGGERAEPYGSASRGELPAAGDLPVALAALLGVQERKGGRFLLGPPLSAHAAAVAGHGERLELIAWVESDADPAFSLDDLSAGANPVSGVEADRWPVRAGSLDGVALAGGTAPPSEAWRALRSGGRLVLFGAADPEVDAAAAAGFRELASDPAAWVGERP